MSNSSDSYAAHFLNHEVCIDSSVAFKWVVPEPYSDKALQLRADYENAVHDLLAPNVFPIEVGHALTRAERQKRIPVGSAVPLITAVLRTLPRLHGPLAPLLRACDISSTVHHGMECTIASMSPYRKPSNVS